MESNLSRVTWMLRCPTSWTTVTCLDTGRFKTNFAATHLLLSYFAMHTNESTRTLKVICCTSCHPWPSWRLSGSCTQPGTTVVSVFHFQRGFMLLRVSTSDVYHSITSTTFRHPSACLCNSSSSEPDNLLYTVHQCLSFCLGCAWSV